MKFESNNMFVITVRYNSLWHAVMAKTVCPSVLAVSDENYGFTFVVIKLLLT